MYLEATVQMRNEEFIIEAWWDRSNNEYSGYEFWNNDIEIYQNLTITNEEADLIHKELQEQSL